MAEREIARKLTIGDIMGKKWFMELLMPAVIAAQAAKQDTSAIRIALCRIFGFVTDGKPGATDISEFVKFAGDFEGVNLLTGEVTRAPSCILPPYLADALYGALKTEGRTGPIKFAFEFAAKYDETSATKYVYVCKDLQPPQADDPMATFRAQLGFDKPDAPALIEDSGVASGGTGKAETPAPAAAGKTAGKK